MMEFFWLSAAMAIALVMILLGIALQLRKLNQQQQAMQQQTQKLESTIKAIENKIEMMTLGNKGMGQRLMATEKKLFQTIERQDDMLNNNSEKLFQRQAERLLKQAARQEEDNTAPSRTEAKLMALVSGTPRENS